MVIAGADMAVADKRAPSRRTTSDSLRVRLQFDEAEHDLRAGAFQVARPADIGFFVEARLQFDQGGDGFAGFRRLDKRAHDRTIGGRAIKRLLDRQHIRIARRLRDELHDDVEGLVRMMDDEVLLLDREKQSPPLSRTRSGKRGLKGLNFRSGRSRATSSDSSFSASMPSMRKTSSASTSNSSATKCAQVLRHMRIDFEPDHRSAAATLQRRLEQTNQVLRLLLNLEIAVADDPEDALTAHEIAGEEPRREHHDHRLDRDETSPSLPCRVGQPDEPLDLARHAD